MQNLMSFIIGVIFNLLFSSIIFVSVPFPSNLAFIIAFVAYFGAMGLIKAEIKHEGVPTLFGKRISWFQIPEGWSWILPRPIMDAIMVDCREKPIDIELKNVLSKDNIPVSIDGFALIQVIDPNRSLNLKDIETSFKELAERTARWLANTKKATELPLSKTDISVALKAVIEGSDINDIDPEITKIVAQEQKEGWKLSNWGIRVVVMFVTDIRLPKSLEDAMTKKQTEEAEKEAETTEIELLAELINAMAKKTGLSPEICLAAIQAERGKRTIFTVEGEAGDFTKGAAITARGGKHA